MTDWTDIETLVFDSVYTAVKTAHTTADIASGYVEVPSAFPHVSIMENAAPAYDFRTLDNREPYINLSYTVEVFSNKADGTAKKECKDIAETARSAMNTLGFRCSYASPTPNADRSVYRYTMRFTGVATRIADTIIIRPV